MTALTRHLPGVVAVAVAACATGCGGRLNEVTGKVTLDGRAVAGLEVTFKPKDPSIGTYAIGYTKADGTYRLHYPGDKTGAPAGEYTVHITGGDEDPDGQKVRIAKKYNADSALTATVASGENVINFEVTSK